MARGPATNPRLAAAAREYSVAVWQFLRSLGVAAAQLDDATQEVFLVAARKLDDIRPGFEKSYLFGAAVHIARAVRRRQIRDQRVALVEDPDDEVLEPRSSTTPEDSLEDKEQRDLLAELLETLPDDLRVTFVLYELEGESLVQIAQLLEIPLGTATSRLRRARAKFEVSLRRRHLSLRGEP